MEEDVRIVCPECQGKYYLKPLYNSVYRCMKCRWRLGMKPENDRGTEAKPLPAVNARGERVLTVDERFDFEQRWDARIAATT